MEIPYGEYNHYKIVCGAYGYSCYLNGQEIHQKRHALHPLLHTAASQDEDRIYLKVVNVGGKEEKTQISVDHPVKERAYAQVIAAGPQETNSFERKEQVSARCHEIESGRDFLIAFRRIL